MRISDWSSDVCSSDLGGGSGAFGAGAVAGTIEMASAGRDVLPLVSASAFYGSRDATELSAAVTPNLDDGFLSLSGRWDRGDGFWTTPADQRGPASVRSASDNWSPHIREAEPRSNTCSQERRVGKGGDG